MNVWLPLNIEAVLIDSGGIICQFIIKWHSKKNNKHKQNDKSAQIAIEYLTTNAAQNTDLNYTR